MALPRVFFYGKRGDALLSVTTIAIANQKGGVSKTTTTVNLGVGLVQEGKKVLLIDLDPQSILTVSLGYPQPDQLPVTMTDLMTRVVMDKPILGREAILHHAEGDNSMQTLGHPVTMLVTDHIIVTVVTHTQLTGTLAEDLLNNVVLIVHIGFHGISYY